jgi:hypothetical protein
MKLYIRVEGGVALDLHTLKLCHISLLKTLISTSNQPTGNFGAAKSYSGGHQNKKRLAQKQNHIVLELEVTLGISRPQISF